MKMIATIKATIKAILPACIIILFSGYFLWHAWHGTFGIESRIRLEAQKASLQEHLRSLQQERATLEQRLNLIRGHNIDEDLLREQAKNILGVMAEDEVMINID